MDSQDLIERLAFYLSKQNLENDEFLRSETTDSCSCFFLDGL